MSTCLSHRDPGVLRHFLGIAAALLLTASPAMAATIIFRDGLANADRLGGTPLIHGRAVTWTSSLPFEDVAVTADLFMLEGQTGQATAYLTTRLGPGTSAADLIAETTVDIPAFEASHQVTLFTGLVLPAGQFYLVIKPEQVQGLWEASEPGDFFSHFFPHPDPPNGTITIPGDHTQSQYVALSEEAFGPGRTFVPFHFEFGTMHFGVTGRLAETSAPPSVPEPSAMALLVVGLVAGARSRSRSLRARRG